jgi:hypothetical protein
MCQQIQGFSLLCVMKLGSEEGQLIESMSKMHTRTKSESKELEVHKCSPLPRNTHQFCRKNADILLQINM